MTEQTWLTCQDSAFRMLDYLRDRVSGRKLRLFACVCCRTIEYLVPEKKLREAIATVERVADGATPKKELTILRAYLKAHSGRKSPGFARQCARFAVEALMRPRDWQAAQGAARGAIDAVVGATAAGHWNTTAGQQAKGIVKAEREKKQADLLRHIIGNPFRPSPHPGQWPAAVVQLANALYQGSDCVFALHDALLDAAHPELAEHFRQEQAHPKGCWAVDLILGKS